MTKPVRRLGGLIFFVTTNLAHRSENLFQNRDNAEIVRACLFDFCEQMKYSIYAWVVMPDHLHAIIGLKGEQTISQVMNKIKGVAARKINLLRKREGSLWQEGFHDEVVRDEAQMLATVDYIHNNPVRTGLVESPDQYEFSSYRVYVEGKMDFSWRE